MPASLAGLGANGIKVVSDVAPLLKDADGLIDFTVPAATLALAELSAAAGIVHVIGTTGHSAEEEALIAKAASRAADRQIRQYEPRRQSARRAWSSAWRRRSARISTSRFWRCITTRRSTRRPARR